MEDGEMKDFELKDTGMKGSGMKDAEMKDAEMKDSGTKDSGMKDTETKDSGMKGSEMKDSEIKDSVMNDPGRNDTVTEAFVCPRCKTTDRSEEQKKKLLNRLSRIEGQIRGIRGMIERDAYCNDILIQSAAASAAINSFNKEILSAHIHSCVVRDIRNGDDEVVDELVATIYKLMK